jgi:uncharacterized protein YbjT (DUF2867 family)
MARALIVGCGCRGRTIGARLLREGWQVRGTSRREQGLAALESGAIEPALADPAEPGSVLDLVGDVALVIWLLGSARGDLGEVAAIHGEKLERVLEGLVETPVRMFAYEAVGEVDPVVLERGAAAVHRAGERWRIPVSLFGPELDMSKLG